jgi:hypothetical protein
MRDNCRNIAIALIDPVVSAMAWFGGWPAHLRSTQKGAALSSRFLRGGYETLDPDPDRAFLLTEPFASDNLSERCIIWEIIIDL